jgi:ureidoacrylate peracid hydrolase
MKLSDKLIPKHTALIVIDIQNDFCSPDGVMGRKGKDTSGMPALVEKLQKLIFVCGRAGVPVYYTQHLYDRRKLNDLQKEQYDLDGKLITCDIVGDGWRLFMLEPPADRVYPKYNYNIFSNDQLKTN